MKIPATHSAAQYMGLPVRKKSKPTMGSKLHSRERKRAAAPAATPKDRGHERKPVAATLKRAYRKTAAASTRRTFAELLDVAVPEARAVQRTPRAPESPRVERSQVPHGMTPAARRMIALAAEARGEVLAPDGIGGWLQRERDKACGITEVARRIIDRAESKA